MDGPGRGKFQPGEQSVQIPGGPTAFIQQTRQSRDVSILFDHRISEVCSEVAATIERKSSIVRVGAAFGYAVGNSIPASTEANLSRPDKGTTYERFGGIV